MCNQVACRNLIDCAFLDENARIFNEKSTFSRFSTILILKLYITHMYLTKKTSKNVVS